MKYILVLLFTSFAFSFTQSGELLAHVEKTYYLKGKVGERDVAIKMLCYDELPTRYINYFFQDAKKDRLLIGNLKDNTWNFIPEVQKGKDEVKPEVTLNLTENKNGVWKGSWTDSTGKTWDLVLNSIVPDLISSKFSYLPFVQELDPYESYRLSKINFAKSKTEKQTKDLLCDWYLEKESGISFFRLRSNNNKLKTDSINATLETINLSLVQKYFSSNSERTDTKVETVLHYLTNELVSFEILSTGTLKTYKTLKTRELLTFDIKSGQQVNLEDLIWFDKNTVKPPPEDLYKVYKYRKSVFAPKIFKLLQELYPDKMKTDSCNINKTDTWALPAWNLTSKGIAFSFNTPDDCDVLNWAVVPYERLEPFMEKRYHLKKM